MNPTKIDWATHCWNPVIGCKRGCSYCYAKKINDRFHLIPDFSKPTWNGKAFGKSMPKKPSRIFVNSMSDICYWSKEEIGLVTARAKFSPQHTFIFLSKDSMKAYQFYSFPENCWLGSTYDGIHSNTCYTNDRNICFMNYEPLMNESQSDYCKYALFGMKWVIVGGLTKSGEQPHKKEWVDDIIKEARRQKIPIFLKSNLRYPEKIQEYPV